MAEKPILFNTEMVKAILEGKKTQTRRVVKPQPTTVDLSTVGNRERFVRQRSRLQVGDTLWVRETWQAQTPAGNWWHEMEGAKELYNWSVIDKATWDGDPPPKWIPSIFMPRWASRITLTVIDVKVEQVQDISEWDAGAEGVSHLPDYAEGIWGACDHFARLWDSINAKRGYSWDSNPWVWVVEFKVAG